MKAAVFTISTEAYTEKKQGRSGAAVRRCLEQGGLEVKVGVLPEDKKVVSTVMKQLADSGAVQLIVTVGASGYMEKDCAPDALTEIADRRLPGIAEAIRAYNIRYSKTVILDRAASGIRNKTLLLNLPEQEKLASEGIRYVLPEVLQAVENLNQ